MFNVEPQEKWTDEEIAEFEAYAAERLHTTLRKASYAGILLIVNVLCVVLFLEGRSLHNHWHGFGRYLLVTAEMLFLWFVYKAGLVWSAWQSARETRREFRDLD